MSLSSPSMNTDNLSHEHQPTSAIEIPEWVIDLHNFRKRLFLKVVEPVIVYLLGPVEEDGEEYLHHHDDYHFIPSSFYDPAPTRRRLGFLPNYVGDASAVRETSMSFATLAMLFTIMTCVLIVFLSCFYHNQKTSPLFASPSRNRLPRLVPPPLPVDGTFSWVCEEKE